MADFERRMFRLPPISVNFVLPSIGVLAQEHVKSAKAVHIVVPIPFHGLRLSLAEAAHDAMNDAKTLAINLSVVQVTVGQWFHGDVIMCPSLNLQELHGLPVYFPWSRCQLAVRL